MLTIQNLLKNVYCCIRNISKKSYRDCAVIVSGFAIFALITLKAQAFGGAGKNKTVPVDCSVQKESGEEAKEEDLEQSGLFAGPDFVSVCRQAMDAEQSSASQKTAVKQQRIAVKVCASLEQVCFEQQQIQVPEAPVSPYQDMVLSQQDREALYRIVQAEAGGEDQRGRILVAEVILNRVLAQGFQDSVYGVIFEKSGGSAQFAPTVDGRYFTVKVTEETKQAVEIALTGEDYSQGALFFSARSKADSNDMAWFDRNLKWLFQYGGHEFYTLP